MDPNEFLSKIYSRIDEIVRKAAKEAVEDALRTKSFEVHDKDDEFLSAEQAAQFLKLKLSTIYSKVEKGELSYYRSGKRKLLFSKKELADHIANHKFKSNKEIADEVDRYVVNRCL